MSRMSMASSSRRSSNSPGPSANINKRGTACLNCRRRKVKCDTERPACGQCIRSSMGDDCEYVDSGPSRTRVLEDTIARLEARIWELENQGQAVPFDLANMDQGMLGSPGRESSEAWADLESPASGIQAVASVEQIQEPPLFVMRILLHNFLHHAYQLGFFLNASHFRESALLPLPLGHHSRPVPALLSTVYLWGVNLSQSEMLMSHESEFLHDALRLAPTTLSSDHPKKTLHAIQNSILLASYFFHTGRVLEGKNHACIATQLVFNNGLHIGRPLSNPNTMGPPSMVESVDASERSNAFWAVVILNNSWSGAVGYPSAFSYSDPSAQITTPWPVGLDMYPQGQALMPAGYTIKDFLSGVPDSSNSVAALHAKASIVFERASHLFAQSSKITTPSEMHLSSPAFTTLDSLIRQIQANLPTLQQTLQLDSTYSRVVLVAHALSQLAAIQLHRRFTGVRASSRSSCVTAALSVAEWVDVVIQMKMDYVNPVMAIFWFMTCQVLMEELTAIRLSTAAMDTGGIQSYQAPTVTDDEGLHAAIEKVAMTMAQLAPNCPVMRYQFTKMQEAFAGNAQ